MVHEISCKGGCPAHILFGFEVQRKHAHTRFAVMSRCRLCKRVGEGRWAKGRVGIDGQDHTNDDPDHHDSAAKRGETSHPTPRAWCVQHREYSFPNKNPTCALE